MRILHFIPNLSGGGAERQLSYLAPELVHMGHDVHIAYSKDGPLKPELPGVVLHNLKSQSNYDPFLLWQIIRLIRSIKPDIIHTWILQMDILGGLSAKLYGLPWILYESTSAMAYSSTWKQRLRVKVASWARAIVSNSRGGDEYWEIALPLSNRYIVLNGIPVSEIDGIVATMPSELAEVGVPIVLYVGRLRSDDTGNKNIKALLESLACVKQHHNFLGVICGEGPQRKELEILRNQLGLENYVHFTGHLQANSSVWALMKKATVFVSLSAFEGSPNTVMEAMACGCPLILSDIPAHRELLDESCALFVDPNNVLQTANCILKALDDMDNSKKMASIARHRSQKLSVTKLATNFEKVYREII